MGWYNIGKFGSAIEAPPAMVKSIMQIVIDYLNKEKWTIKKDQSYKIRVDFAGSKYESLDLVQKARTKMQELAKNRYTEYDQKDEPPPGFWGSRSGGSNEYLYIRDAVKRLDYITLTISPGINSMGNPASFDPSSGQLLIMAPYFMNKRAREDLKGTVEHELIHFVQYYLSLAIYGISEPRKTKVGLPGKQYRTPQFDQYFGDIGEDLIELTQEDVKADDEFNLTPKKIDFIEHASDDVEFYTDIPELLRETLATFERNMPMQQLVNYPINRLVGIAMNFLSWNKVIKSWKLDPRMRMKLRKLLSEAYKYFYKEIQDIKDRFPKRQH